MAVFQAAMTIFKGTIFAMLIALLIRFWLWGVQSVDAGMKRIRNTHIEAAASLGATPFGTVYRVHLPLIKSALWRQHVDGLCGHHERDAHHAHDASV